ncbi:MAG: hypothetical protein ABFS34_05615 [Gemmatimonadota bacterium]
MGSHGYRTAGILTALLVVAPGLQAQEAGREDAQLYRVTLLQAAPGRLLDLIGVLRERFPEDDPASPLIMRHSQGDRWDLMVLGPSDALEAGLEGAAPVDFLRLVRGSSPVPGTAGPEAAPQPLSTDPLDELIGWTEDHWAWGPHADTVRARAEGAGLFHIEMFVALPGERGALIEQRGMENEYLRRIQRPDNLLWVRHAGADWDAFTIGFHANLQAYAEPSPLSQEERDRETVAVGFPGPGQIGAYLRRFLAWHNDTLAVVAR